MLAMLGTPVLSVSTKAADAPDDLIIYEVFVRNFSEAGTLAEVERRLDEIADLGVNVVWLMPIYPIGESLRKGGAGSPYAVRDYKSVHPDLGTTEDLKRLVQATHQRGMKLILDIVPNHIAPDHPWVTEHPDWILRDEKGNPKPPIPSWWDVVGLNYNSAELRESMISVLSHWITECDIDGYRVDVAGMVPEDFWKDAIPKLRALKSGLIMLAEAEGPVYHQLGFDLCYDDSLRNLLVKIARNQEPVSHLNQYVSSVNERYPVDAKLMRFTENHDHGRTTERFPPPMDRAAATLVFTLPGVPLLFAGQEIGMSHLPNLFEHDPVDWKQGDPDVRAFYKQLIQLRKSHPALMRGRWQALQTDNENVVAFLRADEHEEILVLLNFGTDESPVTVTGLTLEPTIQILVDLIGENNIPVQIDGPAVKILAPCQPARILQFVRRKN